MQPPKQKDKTKTRKQEQERKREEKQITRNAKGEWSMCVDEETRVRDSGVGCIVQSQPRWENGGTNSK